MNLDELHVKLNQYLKDQSENWPHFIYSKEKGFYQGFDKIDLPGSRSTEKRFHEYDIFNYFSKKKKILDIGSNCGFVCLYSSECGLESSSSIEQVDSEIPVIQPPWLYVG